MTEWRIRCKNADGEICLGSVCHLGKIHYFIPRKACQYLGTREPVYRQVSVRIPARKVELEPIGDCVVGDANRIETMTEGFGMKVKIPGRFGRIPKRVG